MRNAPPMPPGMPRRNANPARPASCAARAIFTSGTRRAGANACALDRDLIEAAAETDHDAGDAAVADDQIGAKPDDRDGNFGRQMAEKIGQIASSSGMNKSCAGPPTRNHVSSASD